MVVSSPNSKRRRESADQQQQQKEDVNAASVQHVKPPPPSIYRTEQQPSLNRKNSNGNANSSNENGKSNRKTVVVLDVPDSDTQPRRSFLSRDHNNTSIRSLSSVQSSNTYGSAQEFMMKDSESNYFDMNDDDDDNNTNNHHTFLQPPQQQQQVRVGNPATVTTATVATSNIPPPNDASNSTGITLRKSSEGSSNTNSSSNQSTSMPPNGRNSTAANSANHTRSSSSSHGRRSFGENGVIKNRSAITKSDGIDQATMNNNDNYDVADDNDDDDENDSHNNHHEALTGWRLLVHTISSVPNDEYYHTNNNNNNNDKSCSSTSYNQLQKLRITLGRAVSNSIVQTIVVLLIIVNALLMGVATFDFVADNPDVSHVFSVVDEVFLIIFTIELGLQLFYRGISLFHDGWLSFDFIIIILSWSLQSIQIIRAFRIFRALRLVSRLQVLRELITALGAVMPRMYAISMLLFLIFYIFAVLFTQLFGELELSANYFSTLDASLFTCMNMMTLEWINVTREVMTHKSWAWAPISSFISITGFIVYNLVVAVVCDAVAVLDRTKQKDADAAQKVIDDIVYAETQRDQLLVTQRRMDDLSSNVERMKQQHTNMCHTVDMLSSELQQSMIVISNLRKELLQNQKIQKR